MKKSHAVQTASRLNGRITLTRDGAVLSVQSCVTTGSSVKSRKSGQHQIRSKMQQEYVSHIGFSSTSTCLSPGDAYCVGFLDCRAQVFGFDVGKMHPAVL